MNFLPKELENIICHYSHNLKMCDVLEELHENLYWCRNCGTHTHENITPIWKCCEACQLPICSNCSDELKDYENRECDECFFTLMIHSNVELITKHNLTDSEFDDLVNLFAPLHVSGRELICDFIHYTYEYCVRLICMK